LILAYSGIVEGNLISIIIKELVLCFIDILLFGLFGGALDLFSLLLLLGFGSFLRRFFLNFLEVSKMLLGFFGVHDHHGTIWGLNYFHLGMIGIGLLALCMVFSLANFKHFVVELDMFVCGEMLSKSKESVHVNISKAIRLELFLFGSKFFFSTLSQELDDFTWAWLRHLFTEE